MLRDEERPSSMQHTNTYMSFDEKAVDHSQDHAEPDDMKYLKSYQKTIVPVIDVSKANDYVALKQRAIQNPSIQQQSSQLTDHNTNITDSKVSSIFNFVRLNKQSLQTLINYILHQNAQGMSCQVQVFCINLFHLFFARIM